MTPPAGRNGHRGHVFAMVLCCIPMVAAIIWVLWTAR